MGVDSPADKRLQLSHTGLWCAQIASHSAGGAAWAGGSRRCGTTSARSLALGARTPWFAKRGSAHYAQRSERTPKRIRCSRGRGTNAASRCINASGDITRCVLPSRQGVLNFNTTCLAAFVCTRSLTSAEPGHSQPSGLTVPGEGGIGSDSTHWRTGTCGMTWSTRCAAVCAIRRAPHEGQKPRRLQLWRVAEPGGTAWSALSDGGRSGERSMPKVLKTFG